MLFIKTEVNVDGSHSYIETDVDICNMSSEYANVPPSIVIPDTFPFVNIEFDGQTVVNMTAGTMPTPEPTQPDPVTQTQLALAELAETESAHDLENKLALAELAEMIGGTTNG